MSTKAAKPNKTRDTHSSAAKFLSTELGRDSGLGASVRRASGFADDDMVAGSDDRDAGDSALDTVFAFVRVADEATQDSHSA